MKVVQSEGGPLIGFDRKLLHQWGGIAAKRFVEQTSDSESDYFALDEVYPRGAIAPNVARIQGITGAAPLITLPQKTAVIHVNEKTVYLAQLEWAERWWSFSMIEKRVFSEAHYNERDSIVFSVDDCEFMFFDAASAPEMIGDDFLSFPLSAGWYRLSDATYEQDGLAGLILLKIELQSG